MQTEAILDVIIIEFGCISLTSYVSKHNHRTAEHSTYLQISISENAATENDMLILAVLFAGLAVFGTLIGHGSIGQPIGSHGIQCYGWALAVNAAAISALFLIRYRHPLLHDEDLD